MPAQNYLRMYLQNTLNVHNTENKDDLLPTFLQKQTDTKFEYAFYQIIPEN